VRAERERERERERGGIQEAGTIRTQMQTLKAINRQEILDRERKRARLEKAQYPNGV
jgi:hypothetical protein